MTEDKFKSALSMFDIYLTKNEIKAIIDKYSVGAEQVNYAQFCNDLDVVFVDPDKAR